MTNRNGKKRARGISGATERKRALLLAARLAQAYPEVKCFLKHRNAFELLVATILSAQSTDEQVNRVTPRLFERYPGPAELQNATVQEIEGIIRSLGLFRSKARALKMMSGQLVQEFASKVPSRMEELTRLKGVGRKTANVILGYAFGTPGVVVDTHVKRLAGRLGLTKQVEPDRIEKDLMRLLPEKEWTHFSHRLIIHGRKVCRAMRPRCGECVLQDLCPWEGKRTS
ncbi:MAG: endonuclease III [Candidatus Binatia bacterium]